MCKKIYVPVLPGGVLAMLFNLEMSFIAYYAIKALWGIDASEGLGL